MSSENQVGTDESLRKAILAKRLEDLGWGVLLIAIGTIWLAPEKQVPQGSWLIATGLIMLGLNAVRHFYGIKMSGFSLVVGILALLAGTGAFLNLHLPLFAIALIITGVYMILKPAEKNLMNAKTQDWCCVGSAVKQREGQAVSR